jgi:hypothetical protein
MKSLNQCYLSYEWASPNYLSAYKPKVTSRKKSFAPRHGLNQVPTPHERGFPKLHPQGPTTRWLSIICYAHKPPNQTDPKQIQFIYTNDNITLTKTVVSKTPLSPWRFLGYHAVAKRHNRRDLWSEHLLWPSGSLTPLRFRLLDWLILGCSWTPAVSWSWLDHC